MTSVRRWSGPAAVAALSLFAAWSAAAPPEGDEAWAALRHADGRWRLVAASELGDAAGAARGGGQDAAEPRGAWIWSLAIPPHTVEPASWQRELARLRRGEIPSPPGRLAIRLREPCARSCADLRVVAAPVRMWEQVEEAWLPSWPLPESGRLEVPRTSGEPWRVRLVGKGRGGWWQDVEPSQAALLVVPAPAADVPLLVTSASGEPVEGFVVTVMVDEPTGYRPRVLAQFRSADGGETSVPSLPVDGRAVFLAGAPEHASWALAGRGDDVPRPLRLPPGARVVGRFVDGERKPRAGIEVTAEGWASPHLPLLSVEEAVSDESGAWTLAPLAAGRVSIEASGEGLRSYRAELDLEAGETIDLGVVELVPGATLRVAVLDPDGEPLAGASVSRPGAPPATSDDQGLARLTGLAEGETVRLRVTATGLLAAETTVAPPWPDPALVELRHGLSVTGRYVTADGRPVEQGTVGIETGSSFRSEELGTAGDFDLLLAPGVDHTLVLRSRQTPETRVSVAPGLPAEHRDLGTVQAAPGLVAYGRLVAADDGLPLGGARIWAPRLREQGVVAAWAFGDVVEAASDASGGFEVAGLSPRPQELIVDAPGFARRYLEVRPTEGESAVDLGVLEITRGATVTVDLSALAEADGGRLEARLDLRGKWRDFDLLRAPVVEAVAEFVHVPEGESLLTVLGEREIVCEETVVVAAESDGVEVRCDGRDGGVAGVVLVGERPAGPGTLTWQPPPEEDLAGAIFNQHSPRGARQQRVVGMGRPPVSVEVAADGRFRSDRIGAGRWQVGWQALGGEPFAPRPVDVPAGGVSDLALRYAGSVVSGSVRDEDDHPLAGALVREIGGGATVLTAEDGSFRLAGVEGGSVRLQARWRDRYSAVEEVRLEPDRPPPPAELVVRRAHDGLISVRVWSGSGAAAGGAFVFAQSEVGGGIRVVSADRDGEVRLSFPAPHPDRVRFAAFFEGAWSFGSWTDWQEAVEGTSLTLAETGSLRLLSERGGPAALLSAEGWNVAGLLTTLGARPQVAPGRPLSIDGLPAGLYTVGLAERSRTVQVTADDDTEVRLD